MHTLLILMIYLRPGVQAVKKIGGDAKILKALAPLYLVMQWVMTPPVLGIAASGEKGYNLSVLYTAAVLVYMTFVTSPAFANSPADGNFKLYPKSHRKKNPASLL